ncbi:MAG: hypothetical protein HC800_07020 [Phormidesmis sp. RL_2_1]|nr:hypothetical protein [Phormidesmis sp. RL_2_1]
MPMPIPEFATPLSRAKVEQLMQPALIRVIDNIRKQLDVVSWHGRYEEELIWPQGTTVEQQQEYAALQKLLHGVPPAEHDRVAALMSDLPQPSPLYTLRLTNSNHADYVIDIWALCYQVCSEDSPKDMADTKIEADSGLFDDQGGVDWQRLDDKTKVIVEGIFQALPS